MEESSSILNSVLELYGYKFKFAVALPFITLLPSFLYVRMSQITEWLSREITCNAKEQDFAGRR